MDWERTNYAYFVDVVAVHQTDVNTVLGFLSGVELEGMSISENYYSDSRVQAKLSTYAKEGTSDGYVKNARLRIILSIPSKTWLKEMVTGYVSDINESTSNGYTKRTYTIEGTIWGLLNHKIKSPVIINKGAKMSKIWSSLISDQTRMQYSMDGMQDHTFGNTVVYEVGTVLSTILFEVSSGYSRMDVDGRGIITLKKYVAPSNREFSRIVSFDSFKSLAIRPLEMSSLEYEAPGRAIVTATVSNTDSDGKTTQQVIYGSYDAPAVHPSSIEVRGWLKARSDTYSGTSEKPTSSELASIAKKNWENDQEEKREWSASSVFADYHAGDILMLILPDNSFVKVLLKAVETDLSSFTQKLTMKEV